MIRDNEKIYGEMNDPNTVLTTGTLESGKFVVGAGNKGVKTFDPGAKRILYTNASGEAQGFNFNTANKVIGTDASGNLVLRDMPTGKNVIDILVSGVTIGGASSSITGNVFNQPYTSISTAEKAYNLLNGAGDISIVKLNKTADTYTYNTITLTLKNSLVLNATKSVKIVLTVEPDGNYSSSSWPAPWIIGPVKLNSVELAKQYVGGAINFPGQNSVLNLTVSLAAGTYNQIVLENCQLSKGEGYYRVGGCFIY